MLNPAVSCLILNITALVVVISLSLPGIQSIAKRVFEHNGGYTRYDQYIYADRDGEATKESMEASTDKTQHLFIVTTTVCGGAAAFLRAVISLSAVDEGFVLEPWLQLLIWVFLLIQYTALATESLCTVRFSLGLKGSLSYGIALIAMFFEIWAKHGLGRVDEAQMLLVGINTGLAVLAIIPSLSLPRRPDVFRNGTLVDGELSTSFMGRLSFEWATPLISFAARKQDISLEDLPELDHKTRAKNLQDAFTKAESKATSHNSTKPPLWKILLISNGKQLVYQLILSVPLAFLAFAPHLALLEILRLLEERSRGQSDTAQLWLWMIGLGVAVGVSSCLENWLLWIAFNKISIRVVEQLSAVVFSKAMRVNRSSNHESESKQDDESESLNEIQDGSSVNTQNTINLVAVDAQRIAMSATYFYFNFLTPMKLAVACVLLGRLLGWQSLVAGMSCLILLTPLNYVCMVKYSRTESNLMASRDDKMTVLTEALQGIRQIKFSALESKWEAKINQLRDRELQAQGTAFNWRVVNLSLYLLGPVLVSVVSLAVYVLIHGSLTPSVAFTAISVLGYIDFILSMVPNLLSEMLEALVSMRRIDKFLGTPDWACKTMSSDRIQFENATVAWPGSVKSCGASSAYPWTLRNLNVTFPPHGLSVVSGRTGTGKSLLLAAILGECEILSGTTKGPLPPSYEEIYTPCSTRGEWIIPTAMAYVAQTPWIEAATIRDNILFGLLLDAERYHKVLFACALTRDLQDLGDNDLTEIGPNGVNLSGGQKSRISLARALYSRAGILILDDIFSAVDVHTAQHLFLHALTGELAEGRTRILATHHVGLCLSKLDYLVYLDNGMLQYAGNVAEMQHNGILDVLLADEGGDRKAQLLHQDHTLGHQNPSSPPKKHEEDPQNLTPEDPSNAITNPRRFVEEEARERGAVKLTLCQRYIQSSGGWPRWALLGACYMTYSGLLLGQYWWVNVWSRQNNQDSSTEHPDMVYYLSVYIGLSAIAWIIGSLRCYVALTTSIQASRQLFHRLLHVVLRAPLRWLDTVPLGRLLNRFSTDFNMLDSRLGYDLTELLNSVMDCLVVILAGMLVSPILILSTAFLVSGCVWYVRKYLSAAREVKRLECIARSPIYELFDSSCTGLWTIRAFGKAETYIHQIQAKIDRHAQAYWHLYLLNRWLTFRINIIGAFFSTATAIIVVSREKVTGSMAGFAIAFTNQLSFALVLGIRMYANLEMEMNGVERVLEYSDIDTEDYGGDDAPASWPMEGRLDVSNLTVGYAPDLPPVIQGLSFHAEPNQRIGILGRTGAGKSSLALALFRFLEAREGRILVDGVDISTVKLDHLRSRLAIIPQNPVLFTGTVRSNLDPFDEHNDNELLLALEHVRWTSNVTVDANAVADEKPGSPLDTPIAEGGSNLSQGQRQLLCLARAMISNPKILVLDEATSAVDKGTDELIQQSIRSDFGQCATTLLVIAHRINTIADFDRVLVLDAGRAVEFGSPRDLMENDNGYFRRMVEEDLESERLKKVIYNY